MPLRVLLEEWAADEGKETHQEEIYKGLDTKRKEILLATIAHDAFQQNRLFLTRREIANQIEDLLKEMLPDEKNIDGAAVLRSIEVQHGILVERAEGIYSFSHLTLQEYLTAQYIDDHRQIESLVAEHLTDDRWREIFILVAGLMRGGADDLLLQMETAAQQFISTDNLKNLLQWAEQATEGSEGNFKPAAKIAAALAIAFEHESALNDGLPYIFSSRVAYLASLVIESVDIELFSTMCRASIENLNNIKVFRDTNSEAFTELKQLIEIKRTNLLDPSNTENWFSNSKRIDETLLATLKLEPDLTDLTQEEDTLLEDYLYANELIVRCKEAAVRVSSQVWAGIEERMLTVKDEG